MDSTKPTMGYTPQTSPSIRQKKLLTRLRFRYPPLSQQVSRYPRVPASPVLHDPLAALNPDFFPRHTKTQVDKQLFIVAFRQETPIIYEAGLSITEKAVCLCREILVSVGGKMWLMFAGGRWRAGLGYPLLKDTELASGFLKELVGEIIGVLEGGYGMDLDGTMVVFDGLGEVDLDRVKLDDLVLRHFSGTREPLVMRLVEPTKI